MGLSRKIFLPQPRDPWQHSARRAWALEKRRGIRALRNRWGSPAKQGLDVFGAGEIHSSWGVTAKLTFLPSVRVGPSIRGPRRVQRIWKGNKKPISSYSKEIRRVCILKSFLLFFLTTSSFPLLRIKPRAACMPGEYSGPALHPYSKAVFFLLKLSTKFSCTHYLMNS